MGIARENCVLVLLDAVLLTVAYLGAFFLRLSPAEVAQHANTMLATLPAVLAISLVVHLKHGLFRGILRYASLDTALAVFKSVVWSVALSCLVLFLLVRLEGIPRTVFVIHGMAAMLLVGAARLAVRVGWGSRSFARRARRVLLYGAEDNAELVLRGLRSSRDLDYVAVGIVDDNPSRTGKQMHGMSVHRVSAFSELAVRWKVEEVWVCVPDLVGERLRKLYESASAANVRVKILPRLRTALLGQDLGRFQEVRISDLLRRPPRRLDRERMQRWIEGKRVLITGAGGSIGSELSRQVARLRPSSLALSDSCELNLFQIEGELRSDYGGTVQTPYLVDVRDPGGVSRMFRDATPDIVFHAAAYKHVPLVELNPCDGVRTNVQGLCNVALAAVEFGVKEFVFISTDKAVRPTSVMGATKRLGEVVVRILDRDESTRFCAVRFGNVLGSSGSVVPIFQRQIQNGGPVTVTHAEMTRYFMLVSEAVELVIQAGSIGSGGEVFILDMGEPVRIADMARDLIRLMGKEPGRDIEIVYTGPRPGEKIHEELLISRQDVRTPFEDIWIDGEPCPSVSWTELAAALRSLFEAARRGAEDEVVERLKGLVPEFQPAYARTGGALKEDRSVDARMAETVRRARTLERRRAARHLATGVEAVPS